MLLLGNRYDWGMNGTRRDQELALEWWKKAAAVEDRKVMLEACSILVDHYFKHDIEQALHYAKLEARRGSEDDLLKVAIEIVEHYYSHWKDKEKRKIARREAYNIIVDMARWDNPAAKEYVDADAFWNSDEELSEKNKAFFQKRHKQVRDTYYKQMGCVLQFFAPMILSLIGFYIYLFAKPTVQVVMPDEQVKYYSEWNEVTVPVARGKSLRLTGLKWFNHYVYNASGKCLVLRNLCYHNGESTPKEFVPQRYEIRPYQCQRVDDAVNFFFSYPEKYTPPSGGRKHILLVLYEMLFPTEWYELWWIDWER